MVERGDIWRFGDGRVVEMVDAVAGWLLRVLKGEEEVGEEHLAVTEPEDVPFISVWRVFGCDRRREIGECVAGSRGWVILDRTWKTNGRWRLDDGSSRKGEIAKLRLQPNIPISVIFQNQC